MSEILENDGGIENCKRIFHDRDNEDKIGLNERKLIHAAVAGILA